MIDGLQSRGRVVGRTEQLHVPIGDALMTLGRERPGLFRERVLQPCPQVVPQVSVDPERPSWLLSTEIHDGR